MNGVELVTTIYATKRYVYALNQQAARTAACFNDAGIESGVVILATDESGEAAGAVEAYKEALPEGFQVQRVIAIRGKDSGKPYDREPLLRIAKLQGEAWRAARKLRPKQVWSLESDVLPPANALTVMRQMLEFDHGYYDIAMVTYPNAQFLGGRVTPGHWIAPDVYPDERAVPPELQEKIDARTARVKEIEEARKKGVESAGLEWQTIAELGMRSADSGGGEASAEDKKKDIKDVKDAKDEKAAPEGSPGGAVAKDEKGILAAFAEAAAKIIEARKAWNRAPQAEELKGWQGLMEELGQASDVAEDLKKRISEWFAENIRALEPTEDEKKAWRDIDDEVNKCPPKGNVHALNGKQWRRRGWLESAYSGVGRGAVLPTDWVGLGCTLMSARALNLAHFEGYEGRGTQDLFLCHKCWRPAELRMCVIPHVVAHHVKRERNEKGEPTDKINIMFARHEEHGECAGHLRMDIAPWMEEND